MARRIKRKKSGSSHAKRQALSREQISIAGEARYIVERARNFDARIVIVTLGPLVLFSTETGDAWMLDGRDGLALCLALEGKEQSFTIVETPANFSIEWSASYRIDGEKFVVISQPNRVQAFFSYPTAEISRELSGEQDEPNEQRTHPRLSLVILPDCATNGQMREKTGVNSHRQAYMLTRELVGACLIWGEQRCILLRCACRYPHLPVD